MKLGLDIHGVIDKLPCLKIIAELLVSNGHEVHIITGAPWNKVSSNIKHEGIEEYLLSHGFKQGISFTHFFSIVDFHAALGTKIDCDEKGNCWLESNTWNDTKSIYCSLHNIDLHIDDSNTYANLFTSPIAVLKH